ncbi:Com family DNA-binding transcriptional regulator [Faecalicatena contorta]|nr:Com family DNA-binding transcriptional regulator [Faecalicatena contorta]
MFKIEKISCKKCGQTLFFANIRDGTVEIKCPRCKEKNKIECDTKGRVKRRTPE